MPNWGRCTGAVPTIVLQTWNKARSSIIIAPAMRVCQTQVLEIARHRTINAARIPLTVNVLFHLVDSVYPWPLIWTWPTFRSILGQYPALIFHSGLFQGGHITPCRRPKCYLEGQALRWHPCNSNQLFEIPYNWKKSKNDFLSPQSKLQKGVQNTSVLILFHEKELISWKKMYKVVCCIIPENQLEKIRIKRGPL